MTVLREADLWLRRMAILGPIVAFVFGWGTGVLTAAILYKDHEKRIASLEGFVKEQIICHLALAERISKLEAGKK